jgi:hypothetical protein
MIDRPDPAPTLGERLDAEARVLLARAEPSFAWSGGFRVLAAHLAGLAAAVEGRFDRIEALPGAPAVLRAVPTVSPVPLTWTADQTPPGPAAPPGPAPPPGGRLGAPPAAAGPGTADGIGAGQEPSALPRPLPVDVRRRLRDVAGQGAQVMRVHDGGRAAAIARAHAADAVTAGVDVYFREGRLAPDDPRGEALLAHEASHVSASLGRAGAPRRAPGGEEALALGRERAMLAGIPVGPPVQAGPAWSAASVPDAAPAGLEPPVVTRAATDRDTGAEAAPGIDVEALRRSVVDDLMHRLRTEFERGG